MYTTNGRAIAGSAPQFEFSSLLGFASLIELRTAVCSGFWNPTNWPWFIIDGRLGVLLTFFMPPPEGLRDCCCRNPPACWGDPNLFWANEADGRLGTGLKTPLPGLDPSDPEDPPGEEEKGGKVGALAPAVKDPEESWTKALAAPPRGFIWSKLGALALLVIMELVRSAAEPALAPGPCCMDLRDDIICMAWKYAKGFCIMAAWLAWFAWSIAIISRGRQLNWGASMKGLGRA